MARKLLQTSNEDQINLLAINAGGSTIPYSGEYPVYVEGQTIGIDSNIISTWNEVSSKLSQDTWNNTSATFATKDQIDNIQNSLSSITPELKALSDLLADSANHPNAVLGTISSESGITFGWIDNS